MLGVAAFALMGAFSGALTGWGFFAFGDRKAKFGSGAIGVALVAMETLASLKMVLPADQDPSSLVFALIAANIIAFFVVILLFMRMLKQHNKQGAAFEITVIDVIFNNKKALDEYHQSRKKDLERKLKSELGVEILEQKKQALDLRESELSGEERAFRAEIAEVKNLLDEKDEFFDSKFSIIIPKRYKHGIKQDFFELLPRHVMKVGVFYSRLRPLTEQFIARKRGSVSTDEFFESYLMGVANYIRTCLFDQSNNSGENEVRVHFRVLDAATMKYKAKPNLIACDNIQPITELGVNDGLIALSLQEKRSLVFSANRKEAISTGSENLWQDYLTYCFEKIQESGLPKYTLGISVKHKAAHSSFLYFLSFIQIEQIIQQDMIKLHNHLSKFNEEKAA